MIVKDMIYNHKMRPTSARKYPNLSNHSSNDIDELNSFVEQEVDQTDFLIMKKALRTIALENNTLKKQLNKTNENLQKLRNQVCKNLDIKAEQRTMLLKAINDLQFVKEKIDNDTKIPDWLKDQIQCVYLATLEAHTLGIGKTLDQNIKSMMFNNLDANELKTSRTKQSSIEKIQSTYQLEMFSESCEKNPKDICALTTQSRMTSDEDVNSQEYSEIQGVSSPSMSNQSKEMNEQQACNSVKPQSTKPQIPLLFLKENNIECGMWLSGELTRGDTYSAVT